MSAENTADAAPDRDEAWLVDIVRQELAVSGPATLENSLMRVARAVAAAARSRRDIDEQAAPEQYGCHCDLADDEPPDACVIDANRRDDCTYARRHSKKEQCEHWKPIQFRSLQTDGKGLPTLQPPHDART